MQLHHFSELPLHLVSAVCVVRFAEPVGADTVATLADRLSVAHVLEDVTADVQGTTRFLTGTWVPQTEHAHAAAIEQIRALADVGADAAWFLAVATTIDALAAEEAESESESEADEEESEEESSHWRYGEPPGVEAVSFPLEGYPDMLEEFDPDDFGIAIKLAAPAQIGEAAVVRALHRIWIAAYVDRRADERPFRNAAVAFDPVHRAALLWVDELAAPATVAQLVHHLMCVAQALHEIIPIAHARFATASMEQKYGEMMGHEGPPFVLAGNPLRALLADGGAEAWLASQSAWSVRELAAMTVEAGTDLDPDDVELGGQAVALFDRAAKLDPSNADAAAYAQVALVRSGRVDEALVRAKAAATTLPEQAAALRAHTIALVLSHAPTHLHAALPLLDTAAFEAGPDEQVSDILAAVAKDAPDAMPDVLAAVPERSDLVAHVFNATFRCEDAPLRLTMLEHVMDMPVPEPGPHREAFTYAHNNACVLAHGMGELAYAAELADRAQAWADENPYIFHGAACAYVAVGRLEDAMAQVRRAVQRDYDHLDKLELDDDLGELRTWPEFTALFAAHREHLAKAEPVREIGSAEFTSAVLDADGPVLVDFTATWCGPCKRQAPILDRLAQGARGRFRVVKVDIDESTDLAQRYDATSVPTLVVFLGGREIARRVGLSQRAELEALLAEATTALN